MAITAALSLSSKAGSAQDLTWTVVLPTDGAVNVDAVGPTFWIGGTVTDPHGYTWSIATHKEDLTPQEMKQRQDEFMKQFSTKA